MIDEERKKRANAWTPKMKEDARLRNLGKNNSRYGCKDSAKTKQKKLDSWTLKRRNDMSKRISGENHPNYGHKYTKKERKDQSDRWTPEMKADARDEQLEYCTPKMKEDARLANLGKNNPNFGCVDSEETKQKKLDAWTLKRRKDMSKRMSGEKYWNYHIRCSNLHS